MSTLRKQLDLAKAGHEAAKYPGDLATELLPAVEPSVKPAMRLVLGSGAPQKPSTASRWFWALGTSSAVAASLVTAFLLTSRVPQNSPSSVVSGVPASGGGQGAYLATPVDTDRNLANPLENDLSQPFTQGSGIRGRSFVPSIKLAGATEKKSNLESRDYTPR